MRPGEFQGLGFETGYKSVISAAGERNNNFVVEHAHTEYDAVG